MSGLAPHTTGLPFSVRSLAALGACAMVVCGAARCSRPEPPPDPATLPSALRPCPEVASADGIPDSVLADPAVAGLDAAAPYFSAAGCGSVLLLDGWRSVAFSDDAPFPYVWARETVATFEVPRPLTADADSPPADGYVLSVDAGGILYTGEPQRMELFAGERSLGRRDLDYYWKTVEFTVPADVLTSPWNEFRFEFAWTRSPASAGLSDDERSLAAAVARIELRPRARSRGGDPPRVAQLLPSAESGQAELRLPVGGIVTWPLPRRSVADLSLPVALSDAPFGHGPCSFTAYLLDDAAETDDPRRLEPTLDDGTLRLRFETGDGWSRLALGWCPEGAELDAKTGPGDAVLTLPPSALTRRPADRTANEAGGPGRRFDVFLYLIDTVRADALSVYGGARPTPHVAELAQEAVTYRQAWTASSWTLPATVSLLTGVPPSRHGVDTGHRKLGESSVAPLAERLGRDGYTTLGLSQSLVASPLFGLERGFDHFRLDNQLGSEALRSHRLRRLFLRYLSSSGERPLFAYLHSVAPHSPYRPTGGFERTATRLPGSLSAAEYDPYPFNLSRFDDPRSRPGVEDVAKLRAFYEGEVGWADQQLGRFVRLLRHLGLWHDGLFVFTSDHGEEFGEHHGFDHGRTLFEEQLRVPLLVHYPGGKHGGTEVARPVSTMDVTPTVLAVAGVSGDSADPIAGSTRFAGRSLLGVSRAHGDTAEERWLLGVVNPEPADPLRAVDYVALRRGPLKCVLSRLPHDQFGRPVPRYRAFDLASDPGELSPLPETDPHMRECREAFEEFERLKGGPEDGPLTDEQTLDELRALGYLGDVDHRDDSPDPMKQP